MCSYTQWRVIGIRWDFDWHWKKTCLFEWATLMFLLSSLFPVRNIICLSLCFGLCSEMELWSFPGTRERNIKYKQICKQTTVKGSNCFALLNTFWTHQHKNGCFWEICHAGNEDWQRTLTNRTICSACTCIINLIHIVLCSFTFVKDEMNWPRLDLIKQQEEQKHDVSF